MRHRGGQQRVHRGVSGDGVTSVTEVRGRGADHGGHGLIVTSGAPGVPHGARGTRRVSHVTRDRGLVEAGAGIRLQSLAAEAPGPSAETALLKHVFLKIVEQRLRIILTSAFF